jgi:FAD/FMN-containing dehydrogenase
MTRREMLRTSAATVAFGAIGSRWSLRAASEAPVSGSPWMNKHENLTATVDQLIDVWNGPAPNGESWRVGCRKLQAILESAQVKGRRVRAVGGRWSLSPVAICPDVMINTLPLNYHAIGLPAAHVSSTHVDPAHLVFAQCGTSVAELNTTLESNGLALPTSGASNGQTICGAISTGTHGSARRVGSMQDYMLGLHVLAEDGHNYWIEPASKPVVSDGVLPSPGSHTRPRRPPVPRCRGRIRQLRHHPRGAVRGDADISPRRAQSSHGLAGRRPRRVNAGHQRITSAGSRHRAVSSGLRPESVPSRSQDNAGHWSRRCTSGRSASSETATKDGKLCLGVDMLGYRRQTCHGSAGHDPCRRQCDVRRCRQGSPGNGDGYARRGVR